MVRPAGRRAERVLVTGGMGFVGAHTVRALLDLGHQCVATSHGTVRRPTPFDDESGGRVVIQPIDLAERAAVLAIGERHRISGIVHLADPALTHLTDPDLAPATLREDQRRGVGALLNLLEAATVWGARRVTLASTIGVYGGLEDMRGLREDAPLPPSAAGNHVGTWKKTVTYNVGSGYATSNREVAEAIKSAVPEARLELRAGRDPRGCGRDIYLDTARLRGETGFEPRYGNEAAAAEYIAWLRPGHDR